LQCHYLTPLLHGFEHCGRFWPPGGGAALLERVPEDLEFGQAEDVRYPLHGGEEEEKARRGDVMREKHRRRRGPLHGLEPSLGRDCSSPKSQGGHLGSPKSVFGECLGAI